MNIHGIKNVTTVIAFGTEVRMIDEDDLPQAIFDYAIQKYNGQIGGMCEKYVAEFPEKDCELPVGDWHKNFLCWLIYEKVLPQTGKTIAEEFVDQSSEVTSEMKHHALCMRNMVRSDFLVISEKGILVKFKDIRTKKIYDVKRYKNGPRYPLNTIVTGRIFPFGDHYRTTGFFFIPTTPFLLDMDVLMNAYDTDQIDRIENIQLRTISSFQSVMNKYPSHWIDWMCNYYQIKQRLKKDKVREIEQKLTSDISNILQELSTEAKEVLRLCIKNGGFVKYGLLKQYDDDFTFFWEEQPLSSTIGVLRQRGLLFIGKMWCGTRNYRVAFVPIELRDTLQDIFISEKDTQQTSLI
jgi:hypothetical protein